MPPPSTSASFFSEAKASRAINFFHRVLRRPDGTDGVPYRLTPWQYEIVRDVYGTVDANGRRIVRTVLILVPKKNGKSEFAAGNGAYILAGDGNPDAMVYCAASSAKQTGSVFRPAAAMVTRSPLLVNEYRVLKSTHVIHSRRNPLFNRLETLSADGDKADGIKCHGVIADELHRWRERKSLEMWGVLQGGMLSVPEPITFIITTAGEMDESPLLWQYYEYAKAIRAGAIADPHFYAKIYEADPSDDEGDPATWRKANPSLEPATDAQKKRIVAAGLQPGFLRVDELRTLYKQSQHIPRAKADFRRLHLNLWGSKADEACAFDLRAWNAISEPIRPLLARECYGGLDLSTSTDLTSFTLWFPESDGTGDVLSFSWMPEARMRDLELRNHVPYSTWAETELAPAMTRSTAGGLEHPWRVLFTTEGNAVDYTQVREFILRMSKLFHLAYVGYDPKLATETAQWLEANGIEAVPVAQHGGVMSEPFLKTIGLVADGKVRHGNNPLMTWAMSCARAKQTDDNLIRLKKPDREKDSKRIDPVAAWLNAMFCWLRFGQREESIYESRGMAFSK